MQNETRIEPYLAALRDRRIELPSRVSGREPSPSSAEARLFSTMSRLMNSPAVEVDDCQRRYNALMPEFGEGACVRDIFKNLLFIALMCTATSTLARVPFDTDFIGKTVVFLYGAGRDGTPDTHAPIGTGFLLRVPHLNDQDVSTLRRAT